MKAGKSALAFAHSCDQRDSATLLVRTILIIAFVEYCLHQNTADDFYGHQNSFPHFFLRTHKRTIPISLVCIFVAIARRLGLPAIPLNTPGRVLAYLLGTHVDVTEIEGRQIMANDIALQQFTDDGASDRQRAATMLVRASANIYATVRRSIEVEEEQNHIMMSRHEEITCLYAATYVYAMCAGDSSRLLAFVRTCLDDVHWHPFDAPLLLNNFFGDGVLQFHGMHTGDASVQTEEDQRKALFHPAQFVGQIVYNSHTTTIGCIISWEVSRTFSRR